MVHVCYGTGNAFLLLPQSPWVNQGGGVGRVGEQQWGGCACEEAKVTKRQKSHMMREKGASAFELVLDLWFGGPIGFFQKFEFEFDFSRKFEFKFEFTI